MPMRLSRHTAGSGPSWSARVASSLWQELPSLPLPLLQSLLLWLQPVLVLPSRNTSSTAAMME